MSRIKASIPSITMSKMYWKVHTKKSTKCTLFLDSFLCWTDIFWNRRPIPALGNLPAERRGRNKKTSRPVGSAMCVLIITPKNHRHFFFFKLFTCLHSLNQSQKMYKRSIIQSNYRRSTSFFLCSQFPHSNLLSSKTSLAQKMCDELFCFSLMHKLWSAISFSL